MLGEDFFAAGAVVDTDVCDANRPGSVPNSDLTIIIMRSITHRRAAYLEVFVVSLDVLALEKEFGQRHEVDVNVLSQFLLQ